MYPITLHYFKQSVLVFWGAFRRALKPWTDLTHVLHMRTQMLGWRLPGLYSVSTPIQNLANAGTWCPLGRVMSCFLHTPLSQSSSDMLLSSISKLPYSFLKMVHLFRHLICLICSVLARLANHCILFLSWFSTASQLFRTWGGKKSWWFSWIFPNCASPFLSSAASLADRHKKGKTQSRRRRLQIKLEESVSLWKLSMYELFLWVKSSVLVHWLTALLTFVQWDNRLLVLVLGEGGGSNTLNDFSVLMLIQYCMSLDNMSRSRCCIFTVQLTELRWTKVCHCIAFTYDKYCFVLFLFCCYLT